MAFANPFRQDGVWLKANLHTHTTLSDGDTDPAARVAQYAAAGYQVLALTDHRRTADLSGLATPGLTLLRGLEAHPACPNGAIYHLVCLNVPADFPYDETRPAQEIIAAVRAAGGEVIVAHPYWCGHTVAQILALENAIAIEVYNATCSKIGKADSSVFWDYLLATGRTLPAVAVDDVHRGRDIFLGWTMIRAASAGVDDVMTALRAGSYYASCGPEFLDVQISDGVAEVRCSPVREIQFMCRGASGRSIYAEEGAELTSARWECAKAAGYLRVQIADAQGRRAWTNPVVLG